MAFHIPKSVTLACLPLLGLGACAYDDGYGYGGMSAGTGYYGGYNDGFYGPAGNFGGWYNDFYYPGNGYYVFDRGGRRYRWNDRQRNYWEARRQQYRGNDGRRDDDRWRGRDRRDDRSGRPVEGRPGDGRPGDGRRDYDRRPDRSPDATPGREWRGSDGQGRNWRNGSGEQVRPGQPRQEQFRPDQLRQGRPENRSAPQAGQGFRREGTARPQPARPAPSVRQSAPRGAEPRNRTQPE